MIKPVGISGLDIRFGSGVRPGSGSQHLYPHSSWFPFHVAVHARGTSLMYISDEGLLVILFVGLRHRRGHFAPDGAAGAWGRPALTAIPGKSEPSASPFSREKAESPAGKKAASL
ncbi:hypothetical protein JJB98_06365 [Bradyrhizobium diazoefficiens]|nr:hypothetical protein [Bradyrhizobium diazoefficiens]QQO24823.1 hypothetical protein JJB98_06365 [Bradyrhizobium diazoefficiens]